MTTLIRLADLPVTAAIAPIDTVSANPERDDTTPGLSRRPALSGHELELARLREALAVAEAKANRLVVAAREQGRKEALAEFARDEGKSLALLQAGVSEVVIRAREKLGALESLSLAIAENALANVFANPKGHKQAIVDAIARQVQDIKRDTVLSVAVSPADFADAARLDELARALGKGDVRIVQDGALAPGHCRIDLRLGQIEISLPEYWNALRARLNELGASGGVTR